MIGIDLRETNYFEQKKKWVHILQSHVRKKEAFFIRLYHFFIFFNAHVTFITNGCWQLYTLNCINLFYFIEKKTL